MCIKSNTFLRIITTSTLYFIMQQLNVRFHHSYTQFLSNHDERGILLTSYITCEITCFSCQVQYLTFVFTINHKNTISWCFLLQYRAWLYTQQREYCEKEISHTIPERLNCSFCHCTRLELSKSLFKDSVHTNNVCDKFLSLSNR